MTNKFTGFTTITGKPEHLRIKYFHGRYEWLEGPECLNYQDSCILAWYRKGKPLFLKITLSPRLVATVEKQ